MPKRGTVVFFLGSPGSGKTKISKALLSEIYHACLFDKDIFSESITTKKNRFFPTSAKVNDESLYDTILKLAVGNLTSRAQPGFTIIVEGNFGKRLNVEMLKKSFINLDDYDFCLVHITCTNIDAQYNRVLERNHPKDKAIIVEGKTYDLTNKASFEKYVNMRKKEEEECILNMSPYMRVINFDNSINLDPRGFNTLVKNLKSYISKPHNPIKKVASCPTKMNKFRKSEERNSDDTIEIEDAPQQTRTPIIFTQQATTPKHISPIVPQYHQQRSVQSSNTPPTLELGSSNPASTTYSSLASLLGWARNDTNSNTAQQSSDAQAQQTKSIFGLNRI